MPSNNILARRANTALSAYVLDGENADCTDEMNISCLVADLRHLCDAQGWKWETLEKAGYQEYLANRIEHDAADCNFSDPAHDAERDAPETVEYCDQCGEPLAEMQIGMCDSCQQDASA